MPNLRGAQRLAVDHRILPERNRRRTGGEQAGNGREPADREEPGRDGEPEGQAGNRRRREAGKEREGMAGEPEGKEMGGE